MAKQMLWAISATAAMVIGSGLAVKVLMDRAAARMQGLEPATGGLLLGAAAAVLILYSMFAYYRVSLAGRPDSEERPPSKEA